MNFVYYLINYLLLLIIFLSIIHLFLKIISKIISFAFIEIIELGILRLGYWLNHKWLGKEYRTIQVSWTWCLHNIFLKGHIISLEHNASRAKTRLFTTLIYWFILLYLRTIKLLLQSQLFESFSKLGKSALRIALTNAIFAFTQLVTVIFLI